MSSDTNIKESILHNIWHKKEFSTTIKTISGDEIEILDSGLMNEDTAGPDFKNARIRIGNLTYVGDIEIDRDFSDWKNHGHNIDNKYNSVILHNALINKYKHPYVYTRSGRKVPTVCLHDFLDKTILKDFEKDYKESVTHKNRLKCFDLTHPLSDYEKEKFISNLGVQRFQKKCKKIYERLKEIQFVNELQCKEPVISYELTQRFHEKQFKRSDFSKKEIWQQLFFELVFEALGYSKNKTQMIDLAKYANISFLKKIEVDGLLIEKLEAVLFHIGGLVNNNKTVSDADSKNYLEKINFNWDTIKTLYDGRYMDETQWHFFRLRPQNFPTVRLAAGARIIKELLHNNLISILEKKITEIHNLTVLVKSLRSIFVIKSDGYWKNHFVIDKKADAEINYFVGATRADEIIVNVILPFYSVYFEVFNRQNLVKKVLKIFTSFEQKSENQILSQVNEALKMKNNIRKTVLSQGMIDLFRNYCSKNKCLECEIGKAAFN